MANSLSTEYVISVHLKNTEGMTSLLNQLAQLQRVAKEGAEFGVRIDAGALAGVSRAVAHAVRKGVEEGAGDSRPQNPVRRPTTTPADGPTPRRVASDEQIGNLIQEISKLKTAMGHMAAAFKSDRRGGGMPYESGLAPAPAPRRQAATPTSPQYEQTTVRDPAAQMEINRLRNQLSESQRRLNQLNTQLEFAAKATKAEAQVAHPEELWGLAQNAFNAMGISNGHHEINKRKAEFARVMNRPDTGSTEQRNEYNRLYKELSEWITGLVGKARAAEDKAVLEKEELIKVIDKLQREAEVTDRLANRQITNETPRATAWTRSTGSAPRGSGPFSGELLDMSAIEAAFISMADKVGQRILGILGGAPHGGDAANLVDARDIARQHEADDAKRRNFRAVWTPDKLEPGALEAIADSARNRVFYMPRGIDGLGRKDKQQDYINKVLVDREKKLAEHYAKISIDEEGRIGGVSNHDVRTINAMPDATVRRNAALAYQKKIEAQYLGARQGLHEYWGYADPSTINDPAKRQERMLELENSPQGVRMPMEYARELMTKIVHATQIARDARRRGQDQKSNFGILQGPEIEHWNDLQQDPVMSQLLEGDLSVKSLGTVLGRLAAVRQPLGHFFNRAAEIGPEMDRAPRFHPSEAQGNPYVQRMMEDMQNRGWRFAHHSAGRGAELEQKINALHNAWQEQVLPDGSRIKTSVEEQRKIEEKLEPLLEERRLQGRWYIEAHEMNKASFPMRDGLHVTRDELKKDGPLAAFDPIVQQAREQSAKLGKDIAPVWGSRAEGGIHYVDGKFSVVRDPLNGAAANINEMVKGLKEMEKLNLSSLSENFARFGAAISEAMGKLKPMEEILSKITVKENELMYKEQLHEQSMRHLKEKAELRGAGNQKVQEERARIRAQRDLLSRWGQGVMANAVDVQYQSPDELMKVIKGRWSRMGRTQASIMDQNYLIHELERASAPTEAEENRKRRTVSKYSADNVVLAKNALRMSSLDSSYRSWRDPAREFLKVSSYVHGIESIQRKLEENLETLTKEKPLEYEVSKFGIKEAQARLAKEKNYARLSNREQVMKMVDLASSNSPELDALKPQIMAMLTNLNNPYNPRRATKAQREAREASIAKLQSLQPTLAAAGVPVTFAKDGTATLGLKEMGMVAEQTNVKLLEARKTLNDVVGQRLTGDAERASGVWGKFTGKLRELAYYMAAGTVLYRGMAIFMDGLRQVIRLEKEMAEIQGVFINKTPTERKAIEAGVLDTAMRYGVPLSQVTQTAKIFAQTGASPKRTMELTRAASVGAVGAGLNQDQATEMLIAVDNITNSKVTPEEIIDRISRVEARNAVTAQDLSVAIQRVGSVAQQLQPTAIGTVDALDTVIGMSTSIIEKTRVTGNQAATSLRFMLSRIAAPDVARHLQKDFDIKLAENQDGTKLRPLTDILGDIAGKYQGYLKSGNTIRANELLTTFAGARQVNSAAALFSDWDKTMKIAEDSSMAFGDAQRRLAIQMDTLAVQIDRTQNAFYAFMTRLWEGTPAGKAAKGVVHATGYVFEQASKSTGGSMALGGTLLGAVGGVSSWAGGLGATSAAAMGESGALLGGIAGAAGIVGSIVTGIGVFVAAAGLLMLGAKLLNSNEEQRREHLDKYGPSEVSVDDLKQLDFYKRYTQSALNYGMSTNALYSTVGIAAQRTRAALMSDPRFKDSSLFDSNDNLRTNNPALARAYEEQFTKELRNMIPGFEDVGDEAAQTAEALRLFKESLRTGTAMTSVEQSQLQEQYTQIRQGLLEAFSAAGTKPLDPNMPYRVLSNASKARDYKYFHGNGLGPFTVTTVDQVGLAWKAKMSTDAEQDPRQAAYDIMRGLLGGNMAHGTMGLNIQGKGGKYQLLDEAVKRASTGDMTLGESLDSIARESLLLSPAMRALWQKTMDASKAQDKVADALNTLAHATGKEAELSHETARVQTNRLNLAKSLYQPMYDQLEIEARKKKVGNASLVDQGSNMAVGGMQFAQSLVDAYEINIPKYQEQLRANGYADMAAQMDVDRKVLASPSNRGRYAGKVQESMNRGAGRMYTRDRVLQALVRYASQEDSITNIGGAFRETGVGYDIESEQFRNSQTLVQALNEAVPQTHADLAMAYHKMNASSAEKIRNDLKGLGDTTILDDQGRVMPALAGGYAAFAGSIEQNTQLQESLQRNVGIIEQAMKEFGSDHELMDTVPPQIRQWIIDTLASTGSERLARMTMSMDLVKNLANKRLKERAGGMAQRRRSDESSRYQNAMQAIGIRRQYGLAQQGIEAMGRQADLRGDLLGSFNASRYGVSNTYGQALAEAGRARDERLTKASVEFGRTGDQNAYDEARVSAANDYKTAIEEAHTSAITSLGDILNRATENYMQHLEQQVEGLRQGITGPLTDLLTNYKNIGTRPWESLLNMGNVLQGKLASAFIDNLFGKGGIFGGAFDKLFGQTMFMDSSTIHAQQVTLIAGGTVSQGIGDSAFFVSKGGAGTPTSDIHEVMKQPYFQRLLKVTGAPKSITDAGILGEVVSRGEGVVRGGQILASYNSTLDSVNLYDAVRNADETQQKMTLTHELGHRWDYTHPGLRRQFQKYRGTRRAAEGEYYNYNPTEGFAESFTLGYSMLDAAEGNSVYAKLPPEFLLKTIARMEKERPGSSVVINSLLDSPSFKNNPFQRVRAQLREDVLKKSGRLDQVGPTAADMTSVDYDVAPGSDIVSEPELLANLAQMAPGMEKFLRGNRSFRQKLKFWDTKGMSAEDKKLRVAQLKAMGEQAAALAGSLGGAAIFGKNGVNKGDNYAQQGASWGATLGSLIPIPVVGTLIGGMLGGFVGGRIGKHDHTDPNYQALEKIERNTREAATALESQVRMLDIDNRLLGVPAGFVVPQLSPFNAGGAGGSAMGAQGVAQVAGDINITIHDARDPDAVAAAVSQQLRKELRTLGSFSSGR